MACQNKPTTLILDVLPLCCCNRLTPGPVYYLASHGLYTKRFTLFFSLLCLTGSQDDGVTFRRCCRLEGHLKDSSACAADLTAKLTATEAELKQGAVSLDTSLTNWNFLLFMQQLACACLRHCAAVGSDPSSSGQCLQTFLSLAAHVQVSYRQFQSTIPCFHPCCHSLLHTCTHAFFHVVFYLSIQLCICEFIQYMSSPKVRYVQT